MKHWGPWLIALLLAANATTWLWLSDHGVPLGWGSPHGQREPERLERMVRPEALVPRADNTLSPTESR